MNYLELLEQLRLGEIDSFQVTADQFNRFREVWQQYDFQSSVHGRAERGGTVTYVRNEK